MDLEELFNRASGAAARYDGSEPAYNDVMRLAITFEQAGGKPGQVTHILDTAIEALEKCSAEGDILDVLQQGGAQIFHHGAVFVRPDPEGGGIVPGADGNFELAPLEPRLREVVAVLQQHGIFYDDLVIDVGGVAPIQMRRVPYIIVTIPRLDAQIAVADQYGEALFVAKPSLEFMNWALFKKKMVGDEKTIFKDVRRITHASGWDTALIQAVMGQEEKPGVKVDVASYAKEKHKTKYPLTEEMIVAMARLYRECHPEKQWPTRNSGAIDQGIVTQVTGDPLWSPETWKAISAASRQKYRTLTRTLPQILDAHGCHYNLTEGIVVAMARLCRERHPQRQWPSADSGVIDPDIVVSVTGDPHWQEETWGAVSAAGQYKHRSLTRSLPKILKAHGCHYNLTEGIVVAMARLYRERHPQRQWPTVTSGIIDHDIVVQVTGDPLWQQETWGAINSRKDSKRIAQILEAHGGCHYNLTEEMVAAMARFWHKRYGVWPTTYSGLIDHDIVVQATGDPLWQEEKWGTTINASGYKGFRGLSKGRTLTKIIDDHCPERRAGKSQSPGNGDISLAPVL